MRGVGHYSALHAAHRRIETEKAARSAALEMTDRRQERRDRDQAMPHRAEAGKRRREATAAQPSRPVEAAAPSLVPTGPAPGESQGHFVWRQLTTRRIEQEQAREAARLADEIPRILRTERNPIGRRTELRAVFDRREAEEARRATAKLRETNSLSKKEVEAER